MGRINLLDEKVASRIAAGEVIVNPAAVVKELLENAIDAGSTAVTVEIEEGGCASIRVTDNGSGINRDDIGLAVQKHATSKIKDVADLGGIATLGFRGEALASMAAVSRLTISSRERSADMGATLVVNGGAKPEITPAGLPDGTTVKVESLFFNMPARRKFLKSAGTEAARVAGVVSKLIISHVGVSIKYMNNGKVVYHSPGSGELMDALVAVYGADIADKTKPVGYTDGLVAVNGHISKPHALYKNTTNILFYLNGRYIQSKKLQNALLQAYGERLMRSRFPFSVLKIELPFDQADVNVHPSKLQVMFYNEERVTNAVFHAVKETLEEAYTPVVVPGAVEERKTVMSESAAEPDAVAAPKVTDFSLDTIHQRGDKPMVAGSSAAAVMKPVPPKQERAALPAQNDTTQAGGFEQILDRIIEDKQVGETVQTEMEDVRKLVDHKVIGQAFQTYIICECGDALYLIDQHTAHERINYERLKQQVVDGAAMSQQLLVPVLRKMNQRDFDLFSKNLDILNQIGFDIEEFGSLTYKISALPVTVGEDGLDSLLDEMLYELKSNARDVLLARDRLIRAACRCSIKAGDSLSAEQIASLMGEILGMDSIPNCPHGRPIAVAITKNDLQKGFKRTL